jgi:ABC-2 type transport system ATP-binding protein
MIEASGLTRRFGEVVAVDDVSLRVPDGAILALLGPNGAGKTTIVRLLTGVLALTAGRAAVAGYDIGRDPAAVRARVGLVTDVPGLHEQMTVASYLDFFGSIYGIAREARRRRIDELLDFFELAAHRKERMVGFSKGMKQKVALARAVLHEPAALFLDEPTAGLDPLGARAVRELILGMKQASRSIILCTHDLDEAERLADQVAIVDHGKLVARGTPAELTGTVGQLRFRAEAGLNTDELLAALPAGAAAKESPAGHYLVERQEGVDPQLIAAVTAWCAEHGVLAERLQIESRTLEDVFLELTGRELRG